MKVAEFPKLSSNTVVCLSNLLFVCIQNKVKWILM